MKLHISPNCNSLRDSSKKTSSYCQFSPRTLLLPVSSTVTLLCHSKACSDTMQSIGVRVFPLSWIPKYRIYPCEHDLTYVRDVTPGIAIFLDHHTNLWARFITPRGVRFTPRTGGVPPSFILGSQDAYRTRVDTVLFASMITETPKPLGAPLLGFLTEKWGKGKEATNSAH